MPSTSEIDPSTPRRFGDYRIHGLLGEGGMARVYAAEELLSRRPVALKILRAEFAANERGRRQFLTEMGILANLDDPHIVRCLSCLEIERRPVMVLERLEGWTLRTMLEQRGALPWREVIGIATQIAKALHTAHGLRPPIVHRDLKPENVMCLPDGRVKVMDFGIAKVLDSLVGATTHPVGTLRYMSPEHIDARPVDGRADLFALGLISWEMLAGRPPYASDSPRALLDAICTQPTPPVPADAPDALKHLVARLLEKDPAARPASASEVIALLDAAGSGRAVASPRRTRAPATERRHQPPPTEPGHQPNAPAPDTIDLVEFAAHSPLAENLDRAVEAVNRFGRATSAWVARALLSLLALPAAAVVFVGVPASLAVVGLGLLFEEGGVEFEPGDEYEGQLWLFLGVVPVIVASVLFMVGCWRHRRSPDRERRTWPWWVVGGLVLAAWLGATALELSPDTDLGAPIHESVVAAAFAWMTITGGWLSGRVVSLLFARLERRPA